MQALALNVVLFLVGAVAWCVMRFRMRPSPYHAWVLGISTLSGFFTAGIVWSLEKLAPWAMASYMRGVRCSAMLSYVPWFMYALAATLVGSLFWDVPTEVSGAYGPFRFAIQALTHCGIAVCAYCIATHVTTGGGVSALQASIRCFTMVNCMAAIYQVVASKAGLPQVGIARSHDMGVKVASFTFEGEAYVRLGGLCGEPKALAALMVLYLVPYFFGGIPDTRWSRVTAWMACPVLVMTYSTTGFLTLVAALMLCAWLKSGQGASLRYRAIPAAIGIGGVLLAWQLVSPEAGSGSLGGIMYERTIGRVADVSSDKSDVDGVALRAALSRPLVLLLGTGLGGSSFIMRDELPQEFAFAFSPNIGATVVLVETGLLGCILLGMPILRFLWQIRESMSKLGTMERSLATCSATALVLALLGSGPYFALPLAAGGLAALAQAIKDNRERTK